MAAEHEILEYLKKESPINTFRLARELNLDRYKLLNLIKKLEDKGAVEVLHGSVKFLKFPAEEKKEVKKTISKPKKKIVKKSEKIKKKSAVLKTFQAENQELKEKILQLETKLKELEQKPVPTPKIIKKTIIKKVPTFIPLPKKKKKKAKKKISQKKLKIKKFKFPKFNFIKHIKKLKKTKFVKER